MVDLQQARRAGLWLLLLFMGLLLAVSCSSVTTSLTRIGSKNWRRYNYDASSAPAIAQNVMYFGGEDSQNGAPPTAFVFAVDVETAKERWRFQLPNFTRVGYPPTISGNTLYVGTISSPAGVYALDRQTGQLKWQAAVKENVLSPVIEVNGVVCFRSLDGYLYALNAQTGQAKWSFPAPGTLQTLEINAPFQGRPQEVMSAPSVANGLVYIGTRSGLYALEAQTGKPRWKFATKNWVESTPLVKEGRVYIGSGSADRFQGYVYGLDAKSGKWQWQHQVRGFVNSELAIANNIIYFGGVSPNLHAVDLVTGQEKWRFPTKASTQKTTPFVFAGTVFFWFEEMIYALDAKTGTLNWQYAECQNCEGYAPVIQGPVLDNGKLYYLLRDKIYAFDASPKQ